MGVVYEAEHIELGKRVAIKLMLEKYAEDGEAIARFKREALAASRSATRTSSTSATSASRPMAARSS